MDEWLSSWMEMTRMAFFMTLGKGGQKINRTRNCVLLTHVPTGLQVKCQETRSLERNRSIARKLLWGKLDEHLNGSDSKHSAEIRALQKKKARRRAKSQRKYGTPQEETKNSDTESN